MEPIEYTYYEETADEESANEVQVSQHHASSSPSNLSSDYSSTSNSEDPDDGSDQDELDDDEEGGLRNDQDDEDEEAPQAPSFMIPSRTISAVEHPFLVMNVDKALDSFGPKPQYDSVGPKYFSNTCMTMILILIVDSGSQCAPALRPHLPSPQGPYCEAHDVSLRLFSQRRFQSHRPQAHWAQTEERHE